MSSAAAVYSSSPVMVSDPSELLVVEVASEEEVTPIVEVTCSQRLSRRCSYEEVVHDDQFEEDQQQQLVNDTLQMSEWYQCVLRVTQWALTLQEVYEERHLQQQSAMESCDQSLSLSGQQYKCLCGKARSLGKKLANLAQRLSSATQDDGQPRQMGEMTRLVDDVQAALRAGVTIQVSKPRPPVISRANSVVEAAVAANCNRSSYVASAVDSIVKLVDDLLNVPTCTLVHAPTDSKLLDESDRIKDEVHMEQDEEEDIRVRVASMLTQNDEDDDTDTDEDEDGMDTSPQISRMARKRKQNVKGPKSPPTSPSSSPSKRPRRYKQCGPGMMPGTSGGGFCSSAPPKLCKPSPALELLENKKKAQRNSLYHWVLWREALKGEKDRSTNPRRLSFT